MRDAGVHQRGALAAAEDQIHFGQIGARVAAEHFVGVGGELREHGLALLAQQADGVGQIKLAVHVVGRSRARQGQSFASVKA